MKKKQNRAKQNCGNFTVILYVGFEMQRNQESFQ